MQAIIYHRDTPETPSDAIAQTRAFAELIETSDKSDIDKIEIVDIVEDQGIDRGKISEVANRAICNQTVGMILTYSMGTLANSATDFTDLINVINSADVRIGITTIEKIFDPGTESGFRAALDMVAQAEDAVESLENDAAEHDANPKGGRPPLGFERQDGCLAPSSEYDRVVRVLKDTKHGFRSVTGAAEDLDCARSTIRRALDERPELYDL